MCVCLRVRTRASDRERQSKWAEFCAVLRWIIVDTHSAFAWSVLALLAVVGCEWMCVCVCAVRIWGLSPLPAFRSTPFSSALLRPHTPHINVYSVHSAHFIVSFCLCYILAFHFQFCVNIYSVCVHKTYKFIHMGLAICFGCLLCL